MNHSAAVAQYSTVEAAKQQHVVVVVVVVVVVATAAVSVTAVVEPKFLHRSVRRPVSKKDRKTVTSAILLFTICVSLFPLSYKTSGLFLSTVRN